MRRFLQFLYHKMQLHPGIEVRKGKSRYYTKTAEKSNHATKRLLNKDTNRSINQMSKAKPRLFILCLHRLEIKNDFAYVKDLTDDRAQ